SLMYLAQALGREGSGRPMELGVVTSGMQDVVGGELTQPEKATVLGPCKVIPQELEHVVCRSIDVERPSSDGDTDQLADRLIAELTNGSPDRIVAYRGSHRW